MPSCCLRLRQWCFPCSFKSEWKEQIKLLIPITALTVMQYFIVTTAVIFCGRMREAEVGAVSLANSINTTLVITSSLGMVEGYETLFTQAFGGTDKKMMGIYLQRSIVLHMLAFIICLSLLINAEGICIIFGQDREISHLAGQYILRSCPGAFGLYFFTLLSRYLQDMNQVLPTAVIVIIGNIVNVAAHFLFITWMGLQINGSAYAVSVAYMAMLACIVGYMACSRRFADTWPGLTIEMWRGWGKMMKLCVPAVISLSLEFWSLEILLFLTGLLGAVELGSQMFCMTLEAIIFDIVVGVGITTTIRMGQHLGAGDASAAKTACYASLVNYVVPVTVVVIPLVCLKDEIPKLFTSNRDMILVTSQALPMMALYTVMSIVSDWATAVLNASGRQHFAAGCTFLGYYLLGLPLAIYMMFYTSLRSTGMWVSLVGTLTFVGIIMVIIVLCYDWDYQVKRAAENITIISTTEQTEGKDDAVDPNHRIVYDSSNLDTDSPNQARDRRSDTESVSYQIYQEIVTISEKVDKFKILDSDDNLSKEESKMAFSVLQKMSVTDLSEVTILVAKRLTVILIVLLVLVAGILVRLLVVFEPIPAGSHAEYTNSSARPKERFGELITYGPSGLSGNREWMENSY